MIKVKGQRSKVKDSIRGLVMVITMVITFQLIPLATQAQVEVPDTVVDVPTSIPDDIPDLVPDVIPELETELETIRQQADSAVTIDVLEQGATLMAEQVVPVRQKRDWSTWAPDPKRALWLALVIPGGGQIYNRKYWKLPIVYGGFLGCIYAMSWNNRMYMDYSQAYLDLTDDDPETASYMKFKHIGSQITDANADRWKDVFKKRKDKFRRWRDLSFFVMLGIYAVSVIDAYVDAELSQFDISKDLSLRVTPAVINNGQTKNPFYASALGVNCSINF